MAPRMLACLTVAALAGTVSCTDAPLAPQDVAVSATVAPATDSVLLTYLCGNMFRIRNTSFEPRAVRWDIYNATPADTGSLRLRGRDVGATHVDYYVTARTRGTMRVFVGGVLRQTKANGNKPACVAPADTMPLPRISASPAIKTTPSLLDDSTLISRTQLDVKFTASASGREQRAFQRAFSAQYMGMVGRQFIFQIPDPGSNRDSLQSLLQRMNAFAGIRYVLFPVLRGQAGVDGARYPEDGAALPRSASLAKTLAAWPAVSMRLPQAWACETGSYMADPSRISVLEQHLPQNADVELAASVAVTKIDEWRLDSALMAGPQPTQSGLDYFRNYGSAVASTLRKLCKIHSPRAILALS